MNALSKRILNYFFIASFTLILLLFPLSCDLFSELFSDPEPDKKPSPIFPSPKGRLTINGLDSYDNKYAYIQYPSDNNLLVGLTDIAGYPKDVAYQLVKISSGKANIPLYYKNPAAKSYSDSFIAYEGNDTLDSACQLLIIILNDNTLKSSDSENVLTVNLDKKYVTSGLFSDGNMVLDWETADINYDDFIFEINANNTFYSIIGYSSTTDTVILPSRYLNNPVISIFNEAFKNKNITSIVIPYSIASIAVGAFTENPGLATVSIGSKVAFSSDIDDTNIAFDHNLDAVYRKNYKTKGKYFLNLDTQTWSKE